MDPFLGEIRMFAGNFAPLGWSICNGQLISIAENSALYSLIQTTYGGDGVNTFALPDLRGRVPIHQAANHLVGQAAGVEGVTLTVGEMPAHSHTLLGSTDAATATDPTNALLATLTKTKTLYRSDGGSVNAMASQSVSSTPTGLPHSNFQPYLCINFIIALNGIFPSQN